MEELEAMGKSAMISVHHSMDEITCIMGRVKRHFFFVHWWENLFSAPQKAWHILIYLFAIILFKLAYSFYVLLPSFA